MVVSCITMIAPSLLRCTSSSRKSGAKVSPLRKDASVFSGASPAPPRCALIRIVLAGTLVAAGAFVADGALVDGGTLVGGVTTAVGVAHAASKIKMKTELMMGFIIVLDARPGR